MTRLTKYMWGQIYCSLCIFFHLHRVVADMIMRNDELMQGAHRYDTACDNEPRFREDSS